MILRYREKSQTFAADYQGGCRAEWVGRPNWPSRKPLKSVLLSLDLLLRVSP